MKGNAHLINRKRSIVTLVALMVILALPTTRIVSGATTVVVSPDDPGGWGFLVETGGGAGSFVDGPAPAPLGTGSVRLTTATTTGGVIVGVAAYAGTKLSDITALQYSTYAALTSSSTFQAISLQFNIDNDVTDLDFSFKGRLVFEPYYSETVVQGSWQTWTPMTQGRWWGTGLAISASCSIGTPCTWAQVLTNFPNAGIHSVFGAVLFKAGSGWPVGFDGNVDAFTIGITGNSTTYDFEFESVLGPCSVDEDIPNTTLTLLANCVTDHTLFVPDGWTLDGDGYSVTAVDPMSGHFLGAIIKNGGATADVTNLTVTAFGLDNVCDPSSPVDTRLRGILFDGAGGSITNNILVNVNQGPSGCQEGNSIEVRNAPFDNTGTDLAVAITGNVVSGYQKNGITANGSVAATITGNTITGAGAINYIAQNGIQIGFGATAVVQGNTVGGNNYTPKSYVACGLLYFESDGVRASKNVFAANERDVCNFGRGGGNYNPAP